MFKQNEILGHIVKQRKQEKAKGEERKGKETMSLSHTHTQSHKNKLCPTV